jgi:ABC-type lipoprotein release transport system permease subunit
MRPKNFLLISWNYLFSKQKNSTIQYMSRICFIGIFLATFSLSFIISVMTGFEAATYITMQNIYPDLILDADEDSFDMESLHLFLQESKYHVAAYSPHAVSQGLLHNPDREMTPLVIQLKGINAQQETKTSNLEKTILHQKTIASTTAHNKILLGKAAAQALHILPGEQMTFLYSEDSTVSAMKFKEIALTIGGVFETGIDEYDSSLAYCSLECFRSLFPDHDISQVHIKLTDTLYEEKTKQALKTDLGINVYSWKDLYPTLISAMKLETLGMLLILFLIMCIATINIISVLFMYVYQKQQDIALFTCMGLAERKIKYIFLCISLAITAGASILGIVTSYCAGLLLQRYPIIELPANIYYTSHLPLSPSIRVDLAIFAVTLCISFIASLIPLQKISRMDIVLLIKNK